MKNTLNKGPIWPNTSLINSPAFRLLVILFLVIKLTLGLLLPSSTQTRASDLTLDNILAAVNAQRSQRNIVTLNTNNKLAWAAQSKADDMQARHYFAHIDPDGHYIWDKIIAAGYSPYLQLGENLAIEFDNTDSLVRAWMDSPTHRANILNEGFKDQGMGVNLGNVQQGQYYSAIANTFGVLAVTGLPPTPATAVPPYRTATPTINITAPEINTSTPKTIAITPITNTQKSPHPVASSNTSTAVSPLISTKPPADKNAALNKHSNLVLPQPGQKANPTQNATASATQSAAPLGVNAKQSAQPFDYYKLNRYLILLAGLILLALMLSDIRTAVQNRLGHLDKKINNLALLIISLIVIAYMYWF